MYLNNQEHPRFSKTTSELLKDVFLLADAV